MITQKDLFNEPRIQIKDNLVLENAANHLLLLLQGREKELLTGSSVGEIDRRLCAEFWLDEGLRNIIPEDKRQAFVEEADAIDKDWWDAIPAGGDDDKTCGQILTEYRRLREEV